MQIKDSSVSFDGIQPELLATLPIIEPIFNQFGQQLVITSCNDGQHAVNSLHYKGLAFDCRIWDVKDVPGLIAALTSALPAKCWIEPMATAKDHIHYEFRKGS